MVKKITRVVICTLFFLTIADGIQAKSQEPKPGALDYQQALQFVKAGDARQALPLLWKAASDYHEASLWITMGYCYFLLEDMKKSLAAYGMALHYDPGNEEVIKWFSDNGAEVFDGVISVNWRRSRELVKGYNVYLQLYEGGGFFRVNDKPLKKPPFVIEGLLPETGYKVKLSAISDEIKPVEGEISQAQSVFSFHGKLRQKHKTRYKICKGGKLELEWPKSQDPWLVGYNVYLQIPGGRRLELVNHSGEIKHNKYSVKGLAYGMTYLVRIAAVLGSPPVEKVIEELNVNIPLP